MDCPYCGKEMRAGKIPSRDRLKWCDGTEDIMWGDGIRLSEGVQDVQAFFCSDCRRIVVPVPEVEDVWDKMQRKINAASEKLGAVREQFKERQARASQEKIQKKKEKWGQKDPWEL